MLAAILHWVLILLLILYVVSVLLTYVLFYYLVNPHIFDYRMDEEDQLTLVASAGLWALIAVLASPVALVAGLAEGLIVEALLGFVFGIVIAAGGGAVWGLLVGLGVIWLNWDWDGPGFEPVPGFSHVTGLSPEFYIPQESDPEQPLPTIEELERMWAEPVPAAEPVVNQPNPNGREPMPAGAAASSSR
jgi:hypothetical protein